MRKTVRIERVCKFCGKEYITSERRKWLCSSQCRREWAKIQRGKLPVRGYNESVAKGDAGKAIEMIVAARLMLDGWRVFVASGPHGAVDVIAFRDGVTKYLECRLGRYNLNGTLGCSKVIRNGYPQPTEIAVYVVTDGSIHYLPVERQQ